MHWADLAQYCIWTAMLASLYAMKGSQTPVNSGNSFPSAIHGFLKFCSQQISVNSHAITDSQQYRPVLADIGCYGCLACPSALRELAPEPCKRKKKVLRASPLFPKKAVPPNVWRPSDRWNDSSHRQHGPYLEWAWADFFDDGTQSLYRESGWHWVIIVLTYSVTTFELWSALEDDPVMW